MGRIIAYDRKLNPLADLDRRLTSAEMEEELNGEHTLTLETTQMLGEGVRVLWQDGQGAWHEWVIDEPDETHDGATVPVGTYYGTWSMQYDLAGISGSELWASAEDGTLDPIPASRALAIALSDQTLWEPGNVTVSATGAASLYDGQVWDYLGKLVEAFGGEMEPRIEVAATGVVHRYVDWLAHVGSEDVTRRFDYGEDCTMIRRKPAPGPRYCGVRPRGGSTATDSDGVDYTLRVGIEEEPSCEGHDLGSPYLFDLAAKEDFKRPDGSGGYEYPTLTVTYDTTDPEELLQLAQADLHTHTRPETTYEADVLQFAAAGMDVHGAALGDMVHVVDFGFGDEALRLEARVQHRRVNLLDESDASLTIGSFNRLSDAVRELIGVAASPLDQRLAAIEAGGAITYLDDLLDQINLKLNLLGGHAYIVSGQGVICYDIEVDDPLVGYNSATGTWASHVTQIVGGGIRIADSKKASFAGIDDWNWQTLIDSGHIAAELVTAVNIIAGYIGSASGGAYWDLDNNVFSLGATAMMGTGTGARTVQQLLNAVDDSVYEVDVEYALSQSATTAPTDPTAWSTTQPAYQEGHYVWTRTKTVAYSGTTYSEPACISGRDGTSVEVSAIEYGTSGSQSTQPASWGTTAPTVDKGAWLWVRTTYSDGSTMLTKSYVGTDGTPMARNLTPFYSHDLSDLYNATTNPHGYWRMSTANAVALSDGWAHVTLDNSAGTSTMYARTSMSASDAIDESSAHTLLMEIRDLVTDVTSVTSGYRLWYNPADNASVKPQLKGAVLYFMADGTYRLPLTGGGYDSPGRLVYGWFAVGAGKVAEFDARLSLYEGDYEGEYVPYLNAVTGVSVDYGTSGDASTQPGTWSASTPGSLAKGTWLWVRTITDYSDGTQLTSYTKSYAGTDGEDGGSVYVQSATKTGGTTTVVLRDTDGNDTTIEIADGEDGTDGIDGATGYVHVAWATSADGSTGFSTSDSTEKTYLGTYTDHVAADSTDPTDYSWCLIKGADGEDGVGVSSAAVTYGISSSATAQPSSWQSSVPTVAKGTWLWVRTVTTYSDSSTSTTYAKSYAGTDGEDGTSVAVRSATKSDGVTTVVLRDSDGNETTMRIADGSDGTDGTDGLSGYVHTAWATSADGSEGFSTSVSAGKTYLGVYTDNAQADSQTCSDYSWSLIKGADGEDGQDGRNGTDGVGVSSSTVTYGVSASDTVEPSAWQATAPAASQGQWIWTRTVTAYSDGTSTTAYSKGYVGTDGSDGTSVSILGSYADYASLVAAHPTGALGDGYIVAGDLYVWDGTQWADVGQVQGPAGADGTSVTVSAIEYAASSSGTSAPSSGWQSSVPDVGQGAWLWVRTTYSDGTTAYVKAYAGTDGAHAGRNLAPWFSNAPIEVGDYWKQIWNSGLITFTALSDGWVHVHGENTGSAVIRRDLYPLPVDAIVEGADYTFLMEFRNNESVIPEGVTAGCDFYVVQQSNCQFWGNAVKEVIEGGAGTSTNVITQFTPGYTGVYAHRFVKVSEATGSTHWTDGSADSLVGLATLTARCAAGATIDYDVRVSIYEGRYTGTYQPYLNAVDSLTVEYGTSSDASTQPSSWSATAPAVAKGQWLWVRTTTTRSDGTSEVAYTKSYAGTDGEDGTSVTVESATKAGSTTTVVIAETDPEAGTVTRSTLTIADGTNGTDGTPGANGYVHLAWANSADGSTDFSTSVSAGKSYLGTYADNTATDSEDYADYSWTLVKGADGASMARNLNPFFSHNLSDTSYWYTVTNLSAYGTQLADGWAHLVCSGVNVNVSPKVSSCQLQPSTVYTALLEVRDAEISGTVGLYGYTADNSVWASNANVRLTGDGTYRLAMTTKADLTPTAITHVRLFLNTNSGGFEGDVRLSLYEGDYEGDYVPYLNAVSGTAVEYGTSASATTAPSSWSTTAPAVAQGQWLWVRTTTTYSDGTSDEAISKSYAGTDGADGRSVAVESASKSGKVTTVVIAETDPETGTVTRSTLSITDGTDGQNGTPGASGYVHTAWATSSDGTTGFSTSDSEGKTYLGVYTDSAEADSTNPADYSWSLIKGADGNGIASAATTYGTSSSASVEPSSWTTTPPTSVAEGTWIWAKTRTTYDDGTYDDVVSKSYAGSDGRGIASQTVEYGTSASASAQPGSWSTTAPTSVSQGTWVWVRTTTAYDDGSTPTVGYSKSYVGTDGTSVYVKSATKAEGTTTVVITDSDGHDTTLTIEDGADGEDGQPGTNGLSGYVHVAWANSSDGSTDFSTSVSANKRYLGTYTDNTQADSTNPSAYSWTLIKGTDGEDGTGIVSIREQYYLSTSISSQTGGTWGYDQPTWSEGKYIWTRSEITWDTDPQTVTTTAPILATALTQANSTATTAKDTADTAKTTADTAKSTADSAQADATQALSDAADAAKVATNYLFFAPQTGLDLGYEGTDARTNVSGDGVEIFDEDGESAVAITGDGQRIGHEGESRILLDYHSLRLIDRDDAAYFHVSDLRDENGVATVTEYFVADGTNGQYYMDAAVNSVVGVTVDGESISGWSWSKGSIRIAIAVSKTPAGSIVAITYTTTEAQYVFTFGTRLNDGNLAPYSVAEGRLVEASGVASHAEGNKTKATARYAHAEGTNTVASGNDSHAEGANTTASDHYAHAEGGGTVASGSFGSHAEGYGTEASGHSAHAQNYYTKASSAYQTAMGKYNVEDADDVYALIIGNGTSNSARSNAFAVAWNGSIYLRDTTTDRDGSTPSSTQQSAARLYLKDKDNETLGMLWPMIDTNGRTVLRLEAQAEDSGSAKTNHIDVIVARDGTQTYAVSSPANFRSAIGAQATLTETSVTALGSFTDTPASTGNSGYAHKWGRLVQIYITVTLTAQLVANSSVTLTPTLSSGWRPVRTINVMANAYDRRVSISTAGVMTLSTGRAISSGASISFGACYMIP